MTPEEAVLARVMQITAVTSMVSTRVYLDKLPQSVTYPAVRVQLVVEPRGDLTHLRGAGRMRARVQVDAYSREASGVDPYAQASALADAVNGDGAGSGLSGWAGDIGSPAFTITGILPVSRSRDYDPEELRVLRQMQDYEVFFRM